MKLSIRVSQVKHTLWRVRHDVETVAGNWRAGLPEIFRLYPLHDVPLSESAQRLWRNMNPLMTDKKWSAVLGNGIAFTNRSGFPGHHNYILNEDITKPDPYFDQARICGGATVIEKYRDGDRIYIESIDVRKPLPTVEQVFEKHLFFDATLAGSWIGRFPQGDGERVYVPLLTAMDGVYLLEESLQLWTGADYPNPYTIYEHTN